MLAFAVPMVATLAALACRDVTTAPQNPGVTKVGALAALSVPAVETFDTEVLYTRTFSEGGASFTTDGEIVPVWGCRADLVENNYLEFAGVLTGSMTITPPGKSFILNRLDAWVFEPANVLFVGTRTAGGTVSATFAVPYLGISNADCVHINFTGTAFAGVPLTALAYVLPPNSYTFMEIDNVDMNAGVALASKEQCKNNGWKTVDLPRVFKNQGDCIQFANTGK